MAILFIYLTNITNTSKELQLYMVIQSCALRCRIDKLIVIIILPYHSIYYGMKHANLNKKYCELIKF